MGWAWGSADQVLVNEKGGWEGKDNLSLNYWVSQGELQILIQYLLNAYSVPETMPDDSIYLLI